MKTLILVVATSILFIASIIVPIVSPPEPRKPLFENEAAFIASLQRYTEAYHKIASESQKQYFADAYLKAILRDIFVIPVANSTDNIHVILPRTVEGQKVVVLKEIQLGPDNGLREAMYRLVYERHHFKPPFYSAKMGEMLDEVVGE